jgi:hypothetical protein
VAVLGGVAGGVVVVVVVVVVAVVAVATGVGRAASPPPPPPHPVSKSVRKSAEQVRDFKKSSGAIYLRERTASVVRGTAMGHVQATLLLDPCRLSKFILVLIFRGHIAPD